MQASQRLQLGRYIHVRLVGVAVQSHGMSSAHLFVMCPLVKLFAGTNRRCRSHTLLQAFLTRILRTCQAICSAERSKSMREVSVRTPSTAVYWPAT